MKFNYKIFNDTDMVAEIKNSGIYLISKKKILYLRCELCNSIKHKI